VASLVLKILFYLLIMTISNFISVVTPNTVTVADLEVGKFKPVILIDVRFPEEYDRDRIGRSVSVPLQDIQRGVGVQKVQEIVQDHRQAEQLEPTVILYCTLFPSAMRAYYQLQKTGLNLAVLHGGITAWRKVFPAMQDTEILAPITTSALSCSSLAC
jgi:rhodanese-related sulfurtransferase